MLLIKPFSEEGLAVGRRMMSRLARQNDHHRENTTNKVLEDTQSYWMPHPRTGIYIPKGQDWVMDDVPNDAASFDRTFWLRGIDGVDHHKPDTDNFMHNSPN
ncbi:hypothetical protein DH2020_023951 [Rehmannia glutinosa]|uniref:Late embryogenesis abundant protein n=1 Tax=Rehmannia glutinosa TaxID=99300 RepID=A0ABR0W7G2_REHGL